MSAFNCKYCDYRTNHRGTFSRHNASDKHKNNVLSEEWELPLESTLQPMFECLACHYTTSQKGNYDRHIKSINHANATRIVDEPPKTKSKP